MSPDRDSRFTQEDPDDDFDEEEAPRSIFSATWFRVVLVLLGIAVIGVVAVPYVLDVVNPPVEPPKVVTAPPTPSPTPAPAAPRPTVSATPPATPPSSTAAAAPASPETAKPSASPPAPKTTPPAAIAEAPKSAPPARKESARETPRSDATTKSAVTEKTAPKKAAAAPRATDSGDYFVQVGAFKDQAMAMNVAARLRQQNYSVVESVVRVGGAARARRGLAPDASSSSARGCGRPDRPGPL